MNSYDEKGCFNLIAAVTADCFREFRPSENPIITSAININFANSTVLKAWTDCSHNFEYEKLKKLIIAFNTKSYAERQQFKKNLQSSTSGNR